MLPEDSLRCLLPNLQAVLPASEGLSRGGTVLLDPNHLLSSDLQASIKRQVIVLFSRWEAELLGSAAICAGTRQIDLFP